MTIRVPQFPAELDSRRIAAAITRAVLNPVDDNAGSANAKAGTDWLRWSDTIAPPAPRKLNLD